MTLLKEETANSKQQYTKAKEEVYLLRTELTKRLEERVTEVVEKFRRSEEFELVAAL